MEWLKENCLFIIILYIILQLLKPTDSTDINWWNRSGLGLYTDNLTGCQYIKAGMFSSTTPRLNEIGKPICNKTPWHGH